MVGSRPCSERFLFEYSDFPLSSKTDIFKFNSDLDNCQALYHEPLAREITQVPSVILTRNKLLYFKFTVTNAKKLGHILIIIIIIIIIVIIFIFAFFHADLRAKERLLSIYCCVVIPVRCREFLGTTHSELEQGL